MVELPLALGLFDLTTKLFNLPNNRRRLGREKRWIFTAAALGGWLQVFASPHFSRLPSLFYLEKSPRPPAPNKKTKRMFRCARSGCRTPPPRILHLLRSTSPTLIVRRSVASSECFYGERQ
ncbi:MAG TPA: hypothetical protein V6D43_19955 [Candidatus Sericytochromatia bacterium]